MSFYEIVENIDTLDIDEQYELVSILQNKLKDKKREEIYENWVNVKNDINKGDYKVIGVNDFISEMEVD